MRGDREWIRGRIADLETTDGRRLEEEVTYPRGAVETPLSRDELAVCEYDTVETLTAELWANR